MLAQQKNGRSAYARRLILFFLFAGVVLFVAFNKATVATHLYITQKHKVVIDAGHGGTDIGYQSSDGTVYEKNIDLAIVKAIKQLNTDTNIEIILTRKDDHFTDFNDNLEFINDQHAELSVSMHCNDAGKNHQAAGTKVYVVPPEKDNGYMDESIVLAKSITGKMKDDFANRNITIEKQAIWMLQSTKCPAILIEAGYLSNKNDAALLANAAQQKLMAKSILKGIESYLALKEKQK